MILNLISFVVINILENKFIDIGFSNDDYVNNVFRFKDSNLNKKIFHNKGNIMHTCDGIFKTNLK